MSIENAPSGSSPVTSTAAAGGTATAASILDQARSTPAPRAVAAGGPVPGRRRAADHHLGAGGRRSPACNVVGAVAGHRARAAAVTAFASAPVAGLAAVACAAVLVAGIADGTVTTGSREERA